MMERSLKLGHCICNPKQACPCDMFKQEDVCLCAGERLKDMSEEVRLTQFVKNAGCASKISQEDLKKALAGLPVVSDPNVLVSSETCDDAGVYKLSDELALVQSVDIFTPNVDDAYTFGQIAAANSVSDVYAMGGRPLTALSIIGFPVEKLNLSIMNQMLKGGVDKMKEAGVAVVGGHSIKDEEIKFGFAVTGEVHPDKIITNDRARPGDVLVLTKPLGTGVISFAHQLDKAFPFNLAAIGRSMAELNKTASEIMQSLGTTTATDVTGYGLLGHLAEMVLQSRVTAEICVQQVPVFDDVLDFARQDVISGAVERNREFASQYVKKSEDIASEWEAVLYDPQTSGGLLIAIEEKKSEEMVSRLKAEGVEHASIIGKIIKESEGNIILRKSLTE